MASLDQHKVDIETIIFSVFNQKPVSEQPGYLAFLDFSGSEDLEFFKKLIDTIEKSTERGKVLNKSPLPIILFTKNPLAEKQLNVTNFPLQVIQVENFNPEELQTSLKKQIHLPPNAKILYLCFFSNEIPADFVTQIKSFGSEIYGILLLGNSKSIPPNEMLLTLANKGFFPKVQYQHRYPKNSNTTEATLNLLEPRSYIIRHPLLSDIPDLMELERQCWAPQLQESQNEIERRVSHYTQESLVIEQSGKVVAVNYAQRIPSIDVLAFGNWKKLAKSTQNEGDIVRLITLNVEPSYGAKGFGDQLLEFLLYWRALQGNVSKVVASTRCSEFQKHPDKTMEEYILLKDERGLPIDPTPHFHAEHGAKIVGLIPNYRPEDTDNKGYGVLIEYSVKEREYVKPSPSPTGVANATINSNSVTVIKTRDDIKKLVESNISMILGEEQMKEYSPSKPLMDLGFDSLSLLELRSLLSARLDMEIHPRFFFQYGTAEKAINYFAESVLDTYKDWLYNVEWAELTVPLLPDIQGENKGVWVVFVDEGDFAQNLLVKLKSYGHQCVAIKNGPYFLQDNDSEFTIRSDSENDFTRVFQGKIFENGIQGVIYLWGLFKHIPLEPSLEMLQDRHKFSCLGLINLIKAFSKVDLKSTPRLFVGGWSLQEEGDAMSLAQWPLTALSKAVNTERPDFQLRRIALDINKNTKQAADYFYLELFAKDKEDQILWRSGKRFAPRLIRVELPTTGIPEFDENATYLLVGGYGIGTRLIEWYLDRGAKNVIFVTPNESSKVGNDFIEKLRQRDAKITVHTGVNIAKPASLEGIISQINNGTAPLKGLMHFATKVDDEIIAKQTWDRFEALLDLKVAGSWNLHLLTKDLPLDHFILFSAIGPTLDPRTKANRAMGNAFLDALAHYRRALHLPALCINWGPWGNQGLLIQNIMEVNIFPGLRLLTPDEGLNVLDHVMKIALPEVVAAPINWSEFFQHYLLGQPLFTRMEQELGLKKSELVTRFQRAREEERAEILHQYVRMHIRRILLLGSTYKVSDTKTFAELGLKGYMLLDLRNNIQIDLQDQINLPYNLVNENLTINSLSEVLFPLISQASSFVQTISVEGGTQGYEPIAIIGMGCRMPKGVNNPEQFYQFLKNGLDGVTEIPKERWDLESYYSANRDEPGKMYTRYGSFLNDIDQFDPAFFGISPRETRYIDPQARLLLEVSWEALENAGIAPETLVGSPTGVFMGIYTSDYADLLRLAAVDDAHNAYIGTGNISSAVVGRISHFLGLQGPNMALDTACSSSLVALHEACLNLQTKESDIALAGGVQLNLGPNWYIDFSKANMLSPDGHCKTFDASANGYVRGEGCGIVVLKRLSDAIRDGDNIRAIIRSTSVNQDGISSGFTVPNEQAQVSLIKKTIQKAKLPSSDVNYIEAHGTGTPLGDPIEVSAIAETYGKNREEANPLLMGSLKSNIGHLEAAAGVAGLIKVILSLQNESIPKNLNFKELNPKIDLNFPVKIVSENISWLKNPKKRFAAISAFGFSGTNSHAIIEEAPRDEVKSDEKKDRPLHIITLSAKTEQALEALVKSYQKFARENPKLSFANFAYTANIGRSHFKYRIAVVAENLHQFLDKLEKHDYFSGTAPDTISNKISIIHGDNTPYVVDKGDPFHYKVQIPHDAPWKDLLNTLAEHYVQGSAVDWLEFDKPYHRQKIVIPTYPFQRKNYWVKPLTQTKGSTKRAQGHPLLGVPIETPSKEQIFENELDLETLPYLYDHQVYNTVIFPGAGYVEILIAAGRQLLKSENVKIENFTIQAPLSLFKDKPIQVQLLAKPEDNQTTILSLYSRFENSQEWKHHCKSQISLVKEDTTPKIDWDTLTKTIPNAVNVSEFYTKLASQGLQYGKSFQPIQQLKKSENEVLAELSVENDIGCICDPRLLDGCLQALFTVFSDNNPLMKELYLPVGIDSLSLFSDIKGKVRMHGKVTNRNENAITADFEIFGSDGKILASVIGYHARKTDQVHFIRMVEGNTSVSSWSYQVTWEELAKPESKGEQKLKGKWIIFTEGSELGKNVFQKLQSSGCNCLVFEQGDSRLGSKEALLKILREESQTEPIKGIVYLAGTENTTQSPTIETLQKDHNSSLRTALYLSQALIALNPSQVPLVYFVTQGAHVINNSKIAVSQTPFIGFYRTLVLEYPEMKCNYIDLDPEANSELNAASLLEELVSSHNEEQVAMRQTKRYVPRLKRYQEMSGTSVSNELTIDSKASYLVTGGLGGLGIKVGDWLGLKGAKHLVLVGRKAPQEQAIAIINHLKERGIKVEIAQIDISDTQAVGSLIQKFGKDWPELKGIIHAAGVLEDSILPSQDWPHFERVFAPKISGSWNLHQATLTKPLDFFVLFSSHTGVIGSPGQINYSAANAFLDGLANYRHKLKLPALSISWGPWAEVGMAAQLGDRFITSGYTPIRLTEGLSAMEFAMQQSNPHLVLVHADWNVLSTKFPKEQSWLKYVMPLKTKQTEVSDLIPKLQEAIASDRTDILRKHILQMLQQILGLPPDQVISDKQGFFDIGMDSLMAVEFRNKLQNDLGSIYMLPGTLAFDQPNIEAIINYFEKNIYKLIGLDEAKQPVSGVKEEIVETKKEPVESIGADEIARLIEERFAKSNEE